MRLNKNLVTAAAAVCGALIVAGCCSTPEPKNLTQIVVRPLPSLTERPVRAAVDWVRLDDHAVVIRIDGYRHTLGTKGQEMAPVAPPRDFPRRSPNKTQPLAGDSGRVSVNGLPPYANTPAQMAAWRDWCAGENLNDERMALVVGSRLPPNADFPCDEFHRTVWRK